ncbi:unnamed protein product, partial [Urochloa humidicola]
PRLSLPTPPTFRLVQLRRQPPPPPHRPTRLRRAEIEERVRYSERQHLLLRITVLGWTTGLAAAKRPYPVLRAPALCGVWRRVSAAGLTPACAMRGDRGSNPGPVGYRRYALPLHQARPSTGLAAAACK